MPDPSSLLEKPRLQGLDENGREWKMLKREMRTIQEHKLERKLRISTWEGKETTHKYMGAKLRPGKE